MKEKESKWQRLFNYMKDEHGVTLLESDMQEIENIVNPRTFPIVISEPKEEIELPDIFKQLKH
jgi:hypothetical protein